MKTRYVLALGLMLSSLFVPLSALSTTGTSALGAAVVQPPHPTPWNGWNETRVRTATSSISGHAIVFTRPQPELGGDGDVWIMNADGSNETQLTTYAGEDHWPALSPDGSQVAYGSVRNGHQTVWVMNSDGTNPVQLPVPGNTQRLDWSPDGTQLALTNDNVYWWEIWVINADGTNLHRLTTHTEAAGSPAWSPDGQKLVYASEPQARYQNLYTINSDGTQQTLLTSASGTGYSHHQPAWSPDGTQMATIRFPAGSFGPYDLWLMNADGTAGSTLVQDIDPVHLNRLSWSTDGDWIVFAKNGQVWRVHTNGTGLTPINNSGWEPDTQAAAFGLPACSALAYESDIALVLDRSSSMNQDGKIGAAKDALSTFITQTNAPPDQLSLVSFAAAAALNQPLTTDKAVMLAAVQAITITSGTRLDLGIEAARQELGSGRHLADHRKIMILLSDGQQSGGNNQQVIDAANAAKAEGVILYTIGLGADADQDLLQAIATSPAHYYFAPTGDDLEEIYNQISTAIACPNLGGQVFVDADEDGQYTAGIDQPLAGVTVNLAGPVISQTLSTSQADGNYLFPGLLTGTYTVTVDTPSGYQLTTPLSYVVPLTLTDDLNNDFGFTTLPTPTPTATPTACTASPLTTSLVSYWKLDEASGNAIDSHGSNHLPPINAPGTSPGIVNGARAFNNPFTGNQQYFSIPTNPSVEVGTTDFTFSAWVTLYEKTNFHTFVGKQIESYPTYIRDYSLYYDKDLDRLVFQVAGPDGVNLTRAYANNLGSPALNTWYFVVGGYDRANDYVWISVNGGPKQTTPFSGNVHVGPAPFMLGNVDTTGQVVTGYHSGLLDEVGFWKRTLTASELAQLYNTGQGLAYPFGGGNCPTPTPTHTATTTPTPTRTLTPTPTPTACSASPLTNNLIAYWKLDETSGTRLDSTGRGNHLVDNNTVTFSQGKIGNAAQFVSANQEYLSRADNADLSMGDVDFTMAGWVYLDAPKTNGIALGKGNANSFSVLEYGGLTYDGTTDRFGGGISNGSGQTNLQATAFGSPAAGQWYFMIYWHDSVSNQLGVSINGIENTLPYSSGGWDTPFEFRIGSDTCCRFWNGRVDEVGIWKRVLTPSERAALYNNGTGLTYPFGAGNCPTPTPTATTTPTPTRTLTPTPTPTACTASPHTTNLVSYWKLDEASGNALDSHGSNHLPPVNAPGTTPGILNGARSFNGNGQYFSIPTNPSVEVGTTDVSVAAWVRLDNTTAHHAFIGKQIEASPNFYRDYSLYYDVDFGRLVFQVAGPDGVAVTRAIAHSVGSPALNTWYFLAGGYDRTSGYVWISVNGGSKETTPFSGNVHVGPAPFMLGNVDGSAQVVKGYHAGLLDEVGFWKRTLTQSELTQLYNAGQGLAYPFTSSGNCPTPSPMPTPTRTPTPTHTVTATPSPTPVPACFTGPWIYRSDFQSSIGSEWSSTVTSYTPTGRRFLGEFNNQTVSLILTGLPAHTHLQVCFDLYVIRSWDGNVVSDPVLGIVGPDRWSLGVLGQPVAFDTTFTNWADFEQSYPGPYPSNHPAHTGAREVETLGYTYANQPMDSVYRVLATLTHTDNFAVLNFSASGLQGLADESWGIDNIEVISTNGVPLGPYNLYLPLARR